MIRGRVQHVDVNVTRLRLPAVRGRRAQAAFGAIIAAWRRDVGRQLDAGGVLGRRWPVRQAFGDRPGGPSSLQRSGKLRRAWLGGPGSLTQIGPTAASFGIDGDRIPYAAEHRGTTGQVTLATFRRVTRIRVTPKMRRYLAAARGVFLRRATRYLKIPARPHGVASPAIVAEASAIYRSFLLTGEP